MRRTGLLVCAGLLAACQLAGSSVRAAPLGLVQGVPDITSSFITVSYTLSGGVGTFDATGTAAGLDFDGIAPVDYAIDTGSFHLVVTIDPVTSLLQSGTVAIEGTAGAYSGTLIEGTITQFGFEPAGGEIFEFTFDVTGGELASNYGATGGIILDAADTGFTGVFTAEFTNDQGLGGFGVSDTFRTEAVPEPSSLALIFAATLAAPAWRRCRARRPAAV